MLTHRGRSWFLLLGVCGLVGSLVALPAPATAAIVVTSLADPGTGGCTPAACTLREATAAAPAGETITFAPALFAQGAGPGRLRIDGNRASRVFHIGASAVVTLTGRTIRRGHCTGCPGAGILNEGTLTLSRSILRDNRTGSVGGGLCHRSYVEALRPPAGHPPAAGRRRPVGMPSAGCRVATAAARRGEASDDAIHKDWPGHQAIWQVIVATLSHQVLAVVL